MDEETKEKIFDPFFTTKFTGRGLGLATVLGICPGTQGSDRALQRARQGTTIKVLFPATRQPAEPLAKEAPAPGGWRGSGTILLVDDEEPVLEVGGMMLERAGFEVRMASNGREALEVFRQYQGDIVCVVLDLMMPNMDGEETLTELRRIQEDVKVVLSSGYHEQDVTKRLAGTGLRGVREEALRRGYPHRAAAPGAGGGHMPLHAAPRRSLERKLSIFQTLRFFC